MVGDWDVHRVLEEPSPVWFRALLFAVGLDVVGRLFCLATPQASIRWLIIVSVVFQLWSVGLGAALALGTPGAEHRRLLIGGMIAGQIIAATTYTVYLFVVGVYLRSALLTTLATIAQAAMAVTATVAVLVAVLALVVLVLLLVFVVIALCGAGGLLGLLPDPHARLAVPANELTVVLAVALAPIELAYGPPLTAVAWKLWQRSAEMMR